MKNALIFSSLAELDSAKKILDEHDDSALVCRDYRVFNLMRANSKVEYFYRELTGIPETKVNNLFDSWFRDEQGKDAICFEGMSGGALMSGSLRILILVLSDIWSGSPQRMLQK